MPRPNADPPPESPPAPADPAVVARYVGDGSRFTSGVPNRDITEDDQLHDDLLKTAVRAGTHERVK